MALAETITECFSCRMGIPQACRCPVRSIPATVPDPTKPYNYPQPDRRTRKACEKAGGHFWDLRPGSYPDGLYCANCNQRCKAES